MRNPRLPSCLGGALLRVPQCRSAASLVASTWPGCALDPAGCAALAGGGAMRNLGLPSCLGGSLPPCRSTASLVRSIQPGALPGAGGQAMRNLGLPSCLGGALLRVPQCRCAGGQHSAGLCARSSRVRCPGW